jgi:hypothetical protein
VKAAAADGSAAHRTVERAPAALRPSGTLSGDFTVLHDFQVSSEDSGFPAANPLALPKENLMKTSFKARAAALVASTLVTFLLVSEIAAHALPQERAVVMASAAR